MMATPGTAMNEAPKPCVAVLGSGSWGTALAVHLARTGHRTILWGIESEELDAMARERVNARYLPGVRLPGGVEIEHDFARSVTQADQLLVVVPSHAFREVLERVKPLLRPGQRVAWATKGFELATGKLPHDVAAEVLGPSVPTAVLSGPTFAKEVGAGLPSAMTVASKDLDYAMQLARGISGEKFRAYASDDMIGVEVGGATKNVLAIGAGISDGLGFGANTRVALITRGLAEMMRLGVALGADKDTFMGLAGLGDLVLTCTDDQSRNRRCGLLLAAGKSAAEAQAEIRQVVEGVLAARAVHDVAQRLGVVMPISEQIYRVLYEGLAPRDAVVALMTRTIRSETD
jgi:glycerol-3-phosphate dehydrogenase (NAD(P)+)